LYGLDVTRVTILWCQRIIEIEHFLKRTV